MKLTNLVISLLLMSSCISKNQEYGVVEGNVFWNRSDDIGARPDAGSDVKLYSYSDKAIKLTAQADLRGDYRFDKVPIGTYLILVLSKNTRNDEFGAITPLFEYNLFFDSIFHLALRSKSGMLYDKAKSFSGISVFKNTFSEDDYNRLAKERRDSSNVYSRRILQSLPDQFKSEIGIRGDRIPKLFMELIYVKKEETQRIVTDFGEDD